LSIDNPPPTGRSYACGAVIKYFHIEEVILS
jgi:hypothetical protein